MVCSVSLHLGLLVEPSTGCVGLLVVRSVSPAGSHHAPAVSHQSRHTQGPPPPAWSRPSRAVSGSRSWSSEFPAKEKQRSRNTWHFEIMLHARNSFVSSLQTARLVSRRLRSGWLRFLVATDCGGGALEVSHTELGAMEYTWGWFEVGLSDLNRGRGGTQDPAALLPPIPLYRANILYPLGEKVQTSNKNNNFGTERGRIRIG